MSPTMPSHEYRLVNATSRECHLTIPPMSSRTKKPNICALRLPAPRCAIRAAPARPGRHASLGNDTGLARTVRVTHESRPLRPTFRGTNPASTSRAPWRRPGRSYAPGEARFARKGYGSCEDRAGHAQTANTAKSERVENVLLRCSRRSSRRTSPILRSRLLDPFVRDWCAFRAKGRQVCSESIRVIHQSHSL